MRSPRNIFVLCVLPFVSTASAEEEDSLWDIGIGVTSMTIPDYNGASHATTYTLPFPYFVYRGRYLKVVDGRLRAQLFSTERLFLGLSTDGTPPAKSDRNPARAGMPDLDALGEIGPTLEFDLYGASGLPHRLYLNIPLRAAFSTDLNSLDHAGWIANPGVVYKYNRSHWRVSTAASLLYGDQHYHDFYYGVAASYANAIRTEYDAQGGFGGFRWSGSLTYRKGQFWTSLYLRYVDSGDAVYNDSPLVAQSTNTLVGFSVAWIVRSAKRPARTFEGCHLAC